MTDAADRHWIKQTLNELAAIAAEPTTEPRIEYFGRLQVVQPTKPRKAA